VQLELLQRDDLTFLSDIEAHDDLVGEVQLKHGISEEAILHMCKARAVQASLIF
jgi:hypothetical protein